MTGIAAASAAPAEANRPSALFVTTVPITLEAFLLPFAAHFRGLGWRVDALANGATTHPRIGDAFDERFDVAWSRNPLDPRNLIGSAARVRDVVRAGGYDIVHVHTPIAAFVTRYALRNLPAPVRPTVIYTAHGFHFYEGQGAVPHALYRTLERAAGPWTDYLVTINDEDRKAASGLHTVPDERIRFIPGIGVDAEFYAPDAVSAESAAHVRRDLDIPEDAFVLTMIAEFAPVKRHAHLFQALATIRDPRIVVLLVGEGPLEVELRRQAATLGIASRLRWAGYRRDIPAVLAASDALALVSEREGLPRSVLEAMSAERPVIGTRTRGIADAVGTEAGWIVDKHDTDALAAAIDAAAGDAAEVARRGTAARRRVLDRFALPRIIEQYEELYREALASRV